MNNFNLLIYRLQSANLRDLVIFYTLMILVYIYLPEPLWLLRKVISPIVTFMLAWITGLALRNLMRDWR